MSSQPAIPDKRKQLLAEERKLIVELEGETAQLESKLQSSLKTVAVVGTGLLAVALVYKLLDSGQPERKMGKANKKRMRASSSTPSAVTASVISIALQKLLPLAIEKFSTLNSKKPKDEQAAESTTR